MCHLSFYHYHIWFWLEQGTVTTLMWLSLVTAEACSMYIMIVQLLSFLVVKNFFVLCPLLPSFMCSPLIYPHTVLKNCVSSLSMFRHFRYPISSYWIISLRAFWPSISQAFETADIIIMSLYHHPKEFCFLLCWILSVLDVPAFPFLVCSFILVKQIL